MYSRYFLVDFHYQIPSHFFFSGGPRYYLSKSMSPLGGFHQWPPVFFTEEGHPRPTESPGLGREEFWM